MIPGKRGAVLVKDALFLCNLSLMFTFEKPQTACKVEANRNSAPIRLANVADAPSCKASMQRCCRSYLQSAEVQGVRFAQARRKEKETMR
jgi:hypothetical protein